MLPSEIYHDSLNGDTIVVGYFDNGKPTIATPTVQGFATHYGLKLSEVSAIFSGFTPQSERREKLAALLNAAVGMERKTAYELGMCSPVVAPCGLGPCKPDTITEPSTDALDGVIRRAEVNERAMCSGPRSFQSSPTYC